MIGATVNSSAGIPGSLNRAYEDSLNHQTDNLFWLETRYKPNQKLNPADPQDRAMIPRWWAVRTRIAQSRSPRTLIREGAVMTVLDMHRNDPLPVFVHSADQSGSETRSFPSLDDKRKEDYVNARMRDSSYVAIFDAGGSKWPWPISEVYPQAEIEIDQPSSTVSGGARGSYRNVFAKTRLGSAAPSVIYYEGFTLKPLTTDVVARMSDLDPARRDAIATGAAWIDFDGNRRPAKLIRDVFQPGDALYYWDGPWGMLAGSRGIAVVRRGAVVETFTTMMS